MNCLSSWRGMSGRTSLRARPYVPSTGQTQGGLSEGGLAPEPAAAPAGAGGGGTILLGVLGSWAGGGGAPAWGGWGRGRGGWGPRGGAGGGGRRAGSRGRGGWRG